MTIRQLRLKYYYMKKRLWRKSRIFFPSPAEVKFVQLMGGKVITIKFLKAHNTGFPLTIFLSMGKILRSNLVERERRIGGMYADFAFEDPYSKKLIEIDGRFFHRDIVKEQERDEYLIERGWRIMHIEASELYRSADLVQRKVLAFLSK